MTRALRIATVILLVLAGAAFRRWDLYHADPSHLRYVHTSAHGWVGGPDILQLTAVVWLASAAVICLALSLKEKLRALGVAARTQITGGLRGRVSVLIGRVS